MQNEVNRIRFDISVQIVYRKKTHLNLHRKIYQVMLYMPWNKDKSFFWPLIDTDIALGKQTLAELPPFSFVPGFWILEYHYSSFGVACYVCGRSLSELWIRTRQLADDRCSQLCVGVDRFRSYTGFGRRKAWGRPSLQTVRLHSIADRPDENQQSPRRR